MEEGSWQTEECEQIQIQYTEAKRVWTDLWGEPISNRVHVVAGCRGAHESIGVAGEAVAIG